VTITNCDFGTPVAAGPATSTSPGPIYAYNVHDITLTNTLIAGKTVNMTVSDAR
jgi:polygalacturonase